MPDFKLAIFGSRPLFEKPIPVGQLYFPSWERYENAMRGIFERKYYTNQGPLTQQLEIELQTFLGVKHAICITNATIGLIMAIEGLGLSGKVILPAFSFVASAQSLSWGGIEPVFCDIDAGTHQISLDKIDSLIDEDVSGIMGVNLWGDSCKPDKLINIANSHGIPVYFDSAHGFGCQVDNIHLGNFGSLEVFSFHATKVLSATEGGCICTNDDELAARLRNIRSSYGAGTPVNVTKTSNGRMSEAQAAIALLSLEDFPKNQNNNISQYNYYDKLLNSIPGLRIVKPSNVSFSNYQYIVCEIDERTFGISRDTLLKVLNAENIMARRYFYPGIHKMDEYSIKTNNLNHYLPNTDHICDICIQLPIGVAISHEKVESICEIIYKAHINSEILQKFIMRNPM